MKNFYTIPDMTHSELVITLEDFYYDTRVKCRIPSLMPFLNAGSVTQDNITNNSGNILNKDVGLLGVGRCITCNYVELYIPASMSYGEPENRGKKGTKFTAIFVGGDMNQCIIIGRYEP